MTKYNCKYCLKPIPKRTNGKTKNHPIFCDRNCYNLYKIKTNREKALNNELDSTSDGVIKRAILFVRGHKCEICKNSEWLSQPIGLILDHIDGNSDNNSTGNLRLVCGNCDMQLPTYKGRNFGKGRHARRKRYSEGKSY